MFTFNKDRRIQPAPLLKESLAQVFSKNFIILETFNSCLNTFYAITLSQIRFQYTYLSETYLKWKFINDFMIIYILNDKKLK